MIIPSWKHLGAMLLPVLAIFGAPRALAQPAPPLGAESGRLYAFVGLAGFSPQKNSQFSGERGEFGGSTGVGFKIFPYLSVEGALLGVSRHLDTPAAASPAAGTFKDGSLDTSISTGGAYVGVNGHFQLGRFEPYVGLGVGRYTSQLRTTSDAAGCQQHCFDTGPRIDSTSKDTGYHLGIGVDYRFLERNIISVEIRQLKLDANFDDLGIGKVRLGGTLLWLGYRRYFL